MKRIELIKLRLEQFQCFDFYEVEFYPDVTNILGDNGTGKTSLYSGVTWLMFGKDAYDRKEFDIRRKVGGLPNNEVDTIVTGTFRIITEHEKKIVTLKRVLHGVKDKQGTWRDNTLCYVNDVPKLVSEYREYISSIITEDEFRILTSVNYFLSLDMKEQRDYLCRMAGVRSVDDVLLGKNDLKALYATKPADITLTDYIKLSKESLNRLKDDLKGIQPAINALVQSKPTEQNWDEIEQQRKEAQAEVQSLNEQLTSLDESVKEQVAERTKIFKQWKDKENEREILEKSLQASVDAIKQSTEEKYRREKQIYENLISDAKKAEETYVSLTSEVESLKAKCARLKADLDDLMGDYYNTEETTFSLMCPLTNKVCNDITSSDRSRLEEGFEKAKKLRMDTIMAQGKAKNAEYKTAESSLKEKESELKRKETVRQIANNKLASVVAPVMPIIDTQAIVRDYQAKIMDIDKEISEYKSAYEAFEIAKNDEILKAKRDEAQKKADELTEILADRKQIERIEQQVVSKRNEGVQIADKITEMEGLINGLQTIERMIIEDATTRINSLFQITKWQTVTLQKNGTYKDICKPTVNGISASLNTATRINVGLDVAQALSNYKQIQVPLFIDNRESVNQTVKLSMQIINLRVASKGTPLTITK